MVNSFVDHGGNAPEVARPGLAFKAGCEAAHVNPGVEAGRVDVLRLRQEDQVNAALLQQRKVAVKVAGIRAVGPRLGPNWVGLTKMLAAAVAFSALALSTSDR